ncbi:S41 family peptidase [Acidithiobacillus sp. CV18-2]|uniref:S41 family peptidase n=2 Tax=Igneacidithiobacillus copahuensis TaxID=2724909 RepID=A0AAE2YQA4_9PROT|nr:S41 family peptidase [Acidithiobacillus sp. CV18-3]MBU2756645.1 S41 family peptidase [Acidithiobacillus sp. BN09-2]MBU2777636.1 S41 family peptidase [Acidithiobacillus sp. CV18-2]MBU2787988.1 S41 family peptidase [Igneacidithiobacillus copahuensis]MBU2796583.1 S41 family peptidase [Acidithiobacillus sp. VAN18-2]MBU2800631.1 S41 family peptidase [Acidithiobacillus sp. VAN18-4]UTV81261.1 S41 family peptidase [Acidithiobacillus sp. YTS05]
MMTTRILQICIPVLTIVVLALGPVPARAEESQTIPLQEIQTFSQVFALIKSDYVDPSSDQKLMQGAIAGMVHALDPHSAYLTPKEWKQMQVFTDGRFGGVGIEITPDHGLLRVVTPIDGTPAARAGIHAGDLIIKINGKAVEGLGLQKAVDEMRGKPGSQVSLTLLRPHSSVPLQVTLTRAIIKVQSVRYQMIAPDYGYLRISQFQDNTGNAVQAAVKELEKDADGKLKGLILDLRNNPGGVLQAGVETADTFLNQGLIVYTKGRTGSSDMRFRAHGPDLLHGAPVIVLINGGTASAAEIVTGALKDDGRALVLGSRSFGKGSVQSVIRLDNGGALKLTTALYYTPAGCSIQGQGIVPNVAIVPSNPEERQIDAALLKESELEGMLEAPDQCQKVQPQFEIAEPTPPATNQQKQTPSEGPDLATDFVLRKALEILQGNAVEVMQDGKSVKKVVPLPIYPSRDKNADARVKAA